MVVEALGDAALFTPWRATRMLRIGNLGMTAVAVATGALLAGGPVASAPVAFAAAAAVLIGAFGNLLNDVRDALLDKVAHPERPIPSGQVRKERAVAMAGLLLTVGLAFAFSAGWRVGVFAVANAALLGLYEWRLKASGLPGNVLVGLLVGSAFLFGGVAAAGGWPEVAMLWLLAGMAALTNVARELVKDVEDKDADEGHRRTFPLRHGAGATRMLAFAFVNLAVLASVAAFVRGPDWPWPWLVGLAAADLLFLVGGCLAWMSDAAAQRTLKAAMALALAAFLAGALAAA